MIAARCDKSSQVAIISSHFVTPPIPMAEKEAALVVVPSDTPLCLVDERHTEILGQLLYAATHKGLDDGFRIVINNGPNGCQLVYHLHIHLLGGRLMN
ncbi:unnamed protein product [Malus baccata var. baccata]